MYESSLVFQFGCNYKYRNTPLINLDNHQGSACSKRPRL